MNLLESWVQTPAAAALGKTLLHSLWEGAAVALVLAVSLCLLRSSRARYAAGCLAMLSLLAIFGFTFIQFLSGQSRPALASRAAIAAWSAAPIADSAGGGERSTVDYVPWLAPFWIGGVLVFQIRCVTAWMAARRLRRTGVCEPPPHWRERLDRLRARLRISRPVALLESCMAEVPVVIGHIRPVILMPVGLLAGLPACELEAILLHELAHIRRFDYLTNLLQLLVEGLLFYHPAAWWISTVIRAERENCCDDVVVAVHGGASEYAHALAALEHYRGGSREAVAATGGNLMKRIRRLLAQPEQPSAALTPVLTAALLTVTAMTAMAWQSAAPTPQPVPDSPYRRWVIEDVAYIITDAERQVWKQLSTDQGYEHFIEQFWLRRDPTPGTVQNEFKEEHYRRIAFTNERFSSRIPGWKTDRGRIYITYGPADEIESHPSGGSYQRPPEQGGGTTSTFPFEQWRYKMLEGFGSNVIIEFVDRSMTGEYRMTMDPREKDSLLAVPAVANATSQMFYVIGEVSRPGKYALAVPTTVLQALVNAGGFTGSANLETIVIQRGATRLTVNYKAMIQSNNIDQNVLLQPDDQIIVK